MTEAALNKLQEKYDIHCRRIVRATTRDKVNENKAKLEKSYTDWFEYYLPHYAKSKCSWYQKKLANLLINHPIVYIVLRVFRGGAKSVHVNIGIPLYLYLVKKDLGFMLLLGENEKKAKKLLSKVQAELKHNKSLRQDYGSRFRHGDWADGGFTTIDDTHFFALGAGQSPRGISHLEKRPDYISADDIDTKKRSKNPKLVKELFEYLKEDIWGTYGGEKERFIQSNNRFSKNTVVNLMSEHFKKVITEFKEEGYKVVHHIIIAKAIMENGKSGWPERHDLDYWKRKRIATGELSFQREYQDNPIEEGTVFQNEWIHYDTMKRLYEYDALCVYGDLSYKEKGDYKAIVLMGRLGTEFHVIAAFVRKSTRAIAARWLYDLYEERSLKKYNVRYLIEGSFAQDEFVHDFDAEGTNRGYYIPVVADKKSKSNKHERIESMSGFFERGNVIFNSTKKEGNDFKQLEEQILAFEKGSTVNDDAPDAVQSCIAELNTMGKAFNVKTASRQSRIKSNKNRF